MRKHVRDKGKKKRYICSAFLVFIQLYQQNGLNEEGTQGSMSAEGPGCKFQAAGRSDKRVQGTRGSGWYIKKDKY